MRAEGSEELDWLSCSSRRDARATGVRFTKIAVCLSLTKSAGNGENIVQHIWMMMNTLLLILKTSEPVRTSFWGDFSFICICLPFCHLLWIHPTFTSLYGNTVSTLAPVSCWVSPGLQLLQASSTVMPIIHLVHQWGRSKTRLPIKEHFDHHFADGLFHWSAIILISPNQWANGHLSISASLNLANGLVNWCS